MAQVNYRQLVTRAYTDIQSCHKLLESNVPQAYQAIGHTIMAKHTANPFKKICYFNVGKAKLEQAISSDPTNVEWRIYRFSIQSEVPKFLNYSSAILEDKQLMVKYLSMPNADKELCQMIQNVIIKYSK